MKKCKHEKTGKPRHDCLAGRWHGFQIRTGGHNRGTAAKGFSYRATCVAGTVAPSFMGSAGTSRRQAPSVNAVPTMAAMMTVLFKPCIAFSPYQWRQPFSGVPVRGGMIKARERVERGFERT